MLDRFVKYLEYKGETMYSAERHIDVPKGTIYRAVREGSNICSAVLEKIANTYPDLDVAWLVTGKGEMLMGGDFKEAANPDSSTYFIKLSRAQLIEFLKSPNVREENYGLAADSFFILHKGQKIEEELTSDNLFERTVSRWLQERGLNKARLAELMGFSRQSVSSVFNGKPHKDTVMKIGTALAIPKAEIDSLIGEMNYTESREITQRVPSNVFSSLVRAVLKEKKLSQADLAKRMGKSRQNVSILLQEGRTVSMATVYEFAKALAIDPSELV